MLVEIRTGTHVPTDKEVLAVNAEDQSMVGRLTWIEEHQDWICTEQYEEGALVYLKKVTHFVTIENLLKTR